MRLPPISPKTLTLILHSLNPKTFFSSTSNLTKFTQLLNQFSRNPLHPPQIAPRPLHPHPYLYNSLMKQLSLSGNVRQVVQLFREMKMLHCKPDIVCYSTVIDCLVKKQSLNLAMAVFAEVIVLGLSPDVACFTVMVNLYCCYLKQFDSAYEVVRWMSRCGVVPDVVTYSTLITGLCWDLRVEEALGVLDWMLDEKCVPNVHTCTPIVQAYCCLGRICDAMRFVATMERIGCLPNVVTYNVLIEALCKVGDFGEVERVLGESEVKGWEPDEISYSIYMDGLCKFGMVHTVFEVLEVMIGKGLSPNGITLNILLDSLCRGKKVLEAKCLLERSAELDWDVSVVNYNTVMSRLCDFGRSWDVLKLFTDMLKKGIVANTQTFTILINSLCKVGKLRKAKCIFSSEGFVANVVTYTILIHHCSLAREIEEVCQLFSKMEEEKVLPNVVTYSIMIDCLSREGKFTEAVKCFDRSLKDGFSPHLVARLIVGLIRGGKTRDAIKLIEQVKGWGLIVDVCIFSSLIKAFCRMGCCRSTEIYKVCDILDKMIGIR